MFQLQKLPVLFRLKEYLHILQLAFIWSNYLRNSFIRENLWYYLSKEMWKKNLQKQWIVFKHLNNYIQCCFVKDFSIRCTVWKNNRVHCLIIDLAVLFFTARHHWNLYVHTVFVSWYIPFNLCIIGDFGHVNYKQNKFFMFH